MKAKTETMRAFVIAMECEADCVRPWMKPDDRLYVCGIGKVNAAAATQKAICEGATEVWNAGLSGGFGDKVKVGGVYAVEKAVEYDFDLAKLNNTRIGQLDEYDTPYLPFQPVSFKHSQEVISKPPFWCGETPHLRGGGVLASPYERSFEIASQFKHSNISLILATGDHFNDSETDYDLITKELGASLRDMEGAAIAHVCLKAGVPCHSVKCVTNVAGKGSMTGQYEENRRRCLARLSEALKELL